MLALLAALAAVASGCGGDPRHHEQLHWPLNQYSQLGGLQVAAIARRGGPAATRAPSAAAGRAVAGRPADRRSGQQPHHRGLPDKRVVWRFPPPGGLGRESFAGPDDAFLTPHGGSIITNEEFADTIAIIRLGRRPRISFEYGHAGSPGSAPGYPSHPDDAYLLPNGLISVADIINCRVVFIDRDHHVVRSIGRAGDCSHNPPSSLLQPNGDTPTPDGGVLITEIGGWVDRLDRRGHLMRSIQTPTGYPSDAQPPPNGDVLVAGFDTPGHIYVITPKGRVTWTYGPGSGSGALDRPSLAVPIGRNLIAATDDYGQRVVVINKQSKRVVWQYGHLDQPGSAPGYLNKPDGLDLIR